MDIRNVHFIRFVLELGDFCLLEYHDEYSGENQPTLVACCLLHAGFLLRLLFDAEDRGDIFIRSIG
jgi:hypothetical protein